MKWTLILAGVLVLVVFFKLKAAPELSAEAAREKLRQGARLIDVRTPAEFASNRVSGAVNIPLAVVTNELPRQISDKGAVLLLHCRSGRRSGIAEKELRALGYTNVYNIGSFEQAQKIASPR
jgi:phage shock protein E